MELELKKKLVDSFKFIAPAIIAGVSDLGASDIVAFSYAGSAYGFSLLWTVIIVLFFTIFILQITAQIGLTTKRGLLSNVRVHYGSSTAALVAFAIASTNVALITAEISGSSVFLSMLTGVSPVFWAPIVALLICIFAVKGSSPSVKNVLTLMSFVVIVCVPIAFLTSPPLGEIVKGLLRPGIISSKDYIITIMAILGTSISAYSFLFEASEAAQKAGNFRELPLEYTGATIGAIIVSLVDASILIICASLLYPQGLKIEVLEEAILVLKPILGDAAITGLIIGVFASSFLSSAVMAVSNFKIMDELVEDLADVLHIRAAILAGWKVILGSLALLVAPVLLALGISPLKLAISASALSCFFTPVPLIFLSLIFTKLSFPGDIRVTYIKISCWLITMVISVISVFGLIYSIVY